ncbi:MAG TPA: hypothetical protein VF407_25445 [Polyangiaceae bacterium]
MSDESADNAEPQSESTTMKILRAVQIGGSVLGAAAVIFLETRGIRFFGFVPTFILVFIPLFAASAARIVVGKMPKRAWIPWVIGVICVLLATAYAAVGETPSAVL